MKPNRTRHLVRVDEDALLKWLGDQYREKRKYEKIYGAPVGTSLDAIDKSALGFDPAYSAVIGTTFNEGGLSFIVLEVLPHARLRSIPDHDRSPEGEGGSGG
jgi:hypothetical protein